MDNNNKSKKAKAVKNVNVLESLKDVGSSTGKSIKEDLLKGTAEDFIQQLLRTKTEKNYSGEITPGDSLEMNELYTGERGKNEKLRKQISLERNMQKEEDVLVQRRINELRIQLHALTQEVYKLAKTTQNIGEKVEVAAMQAPSNPGIYHIVFFEKLLEFIQSFRKKIENASVWLDTSNKRAQKKNFWARFTGKKGGAKFLLASEHYLTRSAG